MLLDETTAADDTQATAVEPEVETEEKHDESSETETAE